VAIKLIATDLDGTLIGRANEVGLYSRFVDAIDDAKRSDGAIWVICTGRSLRSFKRYFAPMATMGLFPDFVIVKHAYIYEARGSGYVPHLLWNLKTRMAVGVDRSRLRKTVKRWHHMVLRRFMRVRTLYRRVDSISVRFDTEECAATAIELLRADVESCKHLQVFRYGREVDVRPVPFTKGMAVAQLASHLGVELAETLAIGDGHNDISMLNGSTAALTGCPDNSDPEVIETVHQSGGHIARTRALAGVLEVIAAHRAGKPRSELPEWWHDPGRRANGRTQPRRKDSSSRKRRTVRNILMAASAYAALMAFASCGLIPMSGLFMKPVRILGAVIERMFDWFYR